GAVPRLGGRTPVHRRADIGDFLGTRPARRHSRPHHGSRERPDEPGHDAHVDHVGSLLLGIAVPGVHAAFGEGAAADGGDRRDARQHAAGPAPWTDDGAHWHPVVLVCRAVRCLVAHLPLAVSPHWIQCFHPKRYRLGDRTWDLRTFLRLRGYLLRLQRAPDPSKVDRCASKAFPWPAPPPVLTVKWIVSPSALPA